MEPLQVVGHELIKGEDLIVFFCQGLMVAWAGAGREYVAGGGESSDEAVPGDGEDGGHLEEGREWA